MTVDLDALESAYKAATPGQWSWTKEALTVDAELITDGGDSVLVALGYHGGNATIHGEDADKAFIALAHNVMPALLTELREARAQRTVLRVAAGRAKPEADDNEKWARIAYAAYISEQQNEFGGFDFNDLREDIKDSWRRVARDLLAVTILGDN